MTVQEAQEVIFDCDSKMENDVSEDDGYIEFNSDSYRSDIEPDRCIGIPIFPRKTFMSKFFF